MLRRLARALFPPPLPSLEWSGEHWDREYRAQKWDYLSEIHELGRYAMLAAYIRFFERAGSVLEIGCGTGLLYERLGVSRPLRYTGVDISQAAIDVANRHAGPTTRFVAGDGATFSDGTTYDLIVFNESLYYFDDCLAVLAHHARSLAPDGLFLISMVVGDVSGAHWERIDTRYRTLDRAQTRNAKGIVWNFRVLQPDAGAVSGA